MTLTERKKIIDEMFSEQNIKKMIHQHDIEQDNIDSMNEMLRNIQNDEKRDSKTRRIR